MKGSPSSGRVDDCPPSRDAVAEAADRLIQRTGRYQPQLHVLGEMDKTIACDISAAQPTSTTSRPSSWTTACAPASAGASNADSNYDATLVTGGNGYFGSLLVRHLVEAGHQVRVLDRTMPPTGPPSRDRARRHSQPCVVAQAVDGVDVIYHNVAQVPLAKDLELLRSVNVDGTVLLLDERIGPACKGRPHLVQRSVRNTGANPVLPSTVPMPVEAYGHAKLAAEWACLTAAAHGLDVTIVRPRTILGHGRLGIFGILFDWIADGGRPVVFGDGSNRYQFVHADDLAAVCLLAAASRAVDLQRRHRPLRHDAPVARVPLPARRTGARVRRLLPSHLGGDEGRGCARMAPFAPVPLADVLQSLWFDLDHA